MAGAVNVLRTSHLTFLEHDVLYDTYSTCCGGVDHVFDYCVNVVVVMGGVGWVCHGVCVCMCVCVCVFVCVVCFVVHIYLYKKSVSWTVCVNAETAL